MFKGIIGKKLGMTQIFSDDGTLVPATVIEAGPCPVVQIKTIEKEGYGSLQLGFLPKKPQRVNRPLTGHFKKSGKGPFYVLREFRTDETGAYELGQEITVDSFSVGDFVDVTGFTKGRGFTGVIKRHGFRGAKSSHGTHEYFRHGGSIGASASTSRTFKGMKMPGHHGNKRITIQNLRIVDVRPESNILIIRGATPGATDSIVAVRGAIKRTRPKEASEAPE
jgi:large subunit ribosomal protein L3